MLYWLHVSGNAMPTQKTLPLPSAEVIGGDNESSSDPANLRVSNFRDKLASEDLKRYELYISSSTRSAIKEIAKLEHLSSGVAAEALIKLGIESYHLHSALPAPPVIQANRPSRGGSARALSSQALPSSLTRAPSPGAAPGDPFSLSPSLSPSLSSSLSRNVLSGGAGIASGLFASAPAPPLEPTWSFKPAALTSPLPPAPSEQSETSSIQKGEVLAKSGPSINSVSLRSVDSCASAGLCGSAGMNLSKGLARYSERSDQTNKYESSDSQKNHITNETSSVTHNLIAAALKRKPKKD